MMLFTVAVAAVWSIWDLSDSFLRKLSAIYVSEVCPSVFILLLAVVCLFLSVLFILLFLSGVLLFVCGFWFFLCPFVFTWLCCLCISLCGCFCLFMPLVVYVCVCVVCSIVDCLFVWMCRSSVCLYVYLFQFMFAAAMYTLALCTPGAPHLRVSSGYFQTGWRSRRAGVAESVH